jgi:hypothetical protein
MRTITQAIPITGTHAACYGATHLCASQYYTSKLFFLSFSEEKLSSSWRVYLLHYLPRHVTGYYLEPRRYVYGHLTYNQDSSLPVPLPL